MPLPPTPHSRRDSWPPTQIHLDPVLSLDDSSLEDMDQNPMAFFLSPAPSIEDMDVDDDLIMDFDAGIEDLNHPREIVRSVSPSSLEGLGRPLPRRTSPEPELSDGQSPYEDDSEEEYIRFQPQNTFGLPFSLRDFTIDGIKPKQRAATVPSTGNQAGGKGNAADALLSPSALVARGRNPGRGHSRGRPRSLSARRRPPHTWREPSPDVWSIEEEAEEEAKHAAAVEDQASEARAEEETQIVEVRQLIQVQAAKPKKRVRFVLPVKA